MSLFKSLLIFIFVMLLATGFAQENTVIKIFISDKTEIVNGREFYLHKVERGQTLYSIAVAYGVSVSEIVDANSIQNNLISVGVILRIPLNTHSVSDEVFREINDSLDYFFHKVQKQETLFSISRLYGVKISLLEEHNPEVSDGLKVNQVLVIPKSENISHNRIQNDGFSQPIDSSRFFIHTVVQGETLFAISNMYNISVDDIVLFNPETQNGIFPYQKLRIPKGHATILSENITKTIISKDSIKPAFSFRDRSVACEMVVHEKPLNIALLLPLYLNDVEDINVNFSSHAYQRDRNLKVRAFTYIQFYQGFVMALDSLRKIGISANLYVYDVGNDVAQANTFINKPEAKNIDIIIGPFHAESFPIVASFANEHNIIIVNPLIGSGNMPRSNGNLINIPLSAHMQLEQYVRHLHKLHKNKNIIIVNTNSTQENNIINIFKSHWKNIFPNDSAFKFSEVSVSHAAIGNVQNKLNLYNENLILCFSTNEAFVSNFIRKLSDLQNEKTKLSLFGLPSWQNFNNLDLVYLNKLDFRYFSTSYINYNDSIVLNFVANFRELYAIDPDLYAFMGYDMALFFLYAYNNYGKSFTQCINRIPVNLLNSNYRFRFNNETNSYNNTYLNFLKYDDFKVLKE